ncbi:hypothetical protein ABC383_04275 [Noviherbaspirillum sp. 1P10PC]|uniref:hypothetical protein n=1 Tax=Noviherbaspirillum sp. 1P10PC TaxID=3132292 RepID=UPI0039A37884
MSYHQTPGASATDSSAAATLLAEAVSDFLQTGAANAPGNADSFLRAYSTLARSVPKTRRRALYQVMSQALLAAAEKEGLADPAPAAAASQQETEKDAGLGSGPAGSDFMAGLRSQEAQRRRDDVAAGRLLGSADMRERLGISRQALSAAVRAQRLFVLAGPSGDFLYPAFFADARYDRAVLERVSRALGSLPGGAKWEFFTTPRLSLGKRTPLQALAKGQVEEVLAAAAAFADA